MRADGIRNWWIDHRATWRAPTALALLALTLALIVVGLATMAEPQPALFPGNGDVALYRRITDRVHNGQPYYEAAIAEHRATGYPLRPFLTVRPPLLARSLALLPGDGSRRLALATLAAITFAAWVVRLSRRGLRPPGYAAALMLLAVGIAPAFLAEAEPVHEVWAGLLIALSLALRRRDAWYASLAIAMLAALLRELAAPYFLVMAALALAENQRKEAAAWVAGFAVFATALALHATTVNGLVTVSDRLSASWVRFGGWPFVLQASEWALLGPLAPRWLVPVLVPLALFGLTAWRGALGHRLALTVLGYVIGFLCFGRADNSYWGLMIAPLLPLGLLATWPALRRCLGDLRGDVVPGRRPIMRPDRIA
jgi:hypothetical protein